MLYRLSEPKRIGEPTRWGKIQAVGLIEGERYYWMIDSRGIVAMIPADVVENEKRAGGGEGV